jgi:holo-[acyl-carrier protein] synthase
VIGIGVDLVEIDRFRRTVERTPTLLGRVFTTGERAYAEARRDPAERYAVRFAAKEAVLKALGAGLFDVPLRQIEVVRASTGRPSLALHDEAADLAAGQGVGRWLLTLTHTDHLAEAIAVALPAAVEGPPR